MKTFTLFALSLATLSSSAQAETLKCWNTFSPRGSAPALVANIVADDELNQLEAPKQGKQSGDEIEVPSGSVRGALITSNRSPYKGNQEFALTNVRLILPVRLDAQSLLEAEKTGIGRSRGENGVMIGKFKGSTDGGSHFSYRLRCRNYAN